MAATTTQRPPALPGQQNAPRTPKGAAKMSKTYLDANSLPRRSPTPVPVDEDDRRTAHVIRQCTHMSTVNGGGKERCTVDRDWFLPTDPDVFCRAHGEKLTALEEGPSQLALTVQAAREMHGRSAAPWLIPAGMVATDAAMHLAGFGFEAGLIAPALAGAGYLVAKRKLTKLAIDRKRLEKGEKSGRRYERLRRDARSFAWYGGEAGLWAAALAGTDVTHLPGVLIAGLGMARWAYACRDWWKSADQRRASIGVVKVDAAAVGEQAKQPDVQPPDEVELRAVTTWKSIIGAQGGVLAGTRLVEFRRLPNCRARAAERTLLPNWQAKVVAVNDGSIDMSAPRPSLPGKLAAAYKCTYADVSFHADEADNGIGWVRVQPDNPLAEVRMWSGLTATDWDKGISQVGRFDDSQPIEYAWWTKTGAAHDLIGGSSGGGKSEFIAQLILTSLHSGGLVLDWVGDPQGGQSFGALKDKVDWFARDVSEIQLMLLAAVKEMYRRNDELTDNRIKTWKPTLDMPLLVITLDEVQSYLGDTGVVHELVTKLAGMGRKCGIKLRLSTQIVAAYNLGGDTYIKDQVKTGQTFSFRSETDQAARSAIEGDSPIDPTMLPKRWGAHTCAAGETTAGLVFVQGLHGRDLYGRIDYTGDSMDGWLVGPDGRPSTTPGAFCAEARAASGVLWGDRVERARRLVEAGRNDEDLLTGGKAVELIEAASVSSTTKTVTRSPAESEAPLQERARDAVFSAAMELAEESETITKQALLTAVEGRMAPKTLDKAISDLLGDGFLTRVKNGVYAVPGAKKPSVAAPEVVAE